MVEESDMNYTDKMTKVVLILACVLEAGVAIGISAIVHHFFLLAISSMGSSFLWSDSEETVPVYPLWEQGALLVLPVLAVLAGAAPSLMRAGSATKKIKLLSISSALCIGAGMLGILGIIVGISPGLSLSLLLIIALVPIPILVGIWGSVQVA